MADTCLTPEQQFVVREWRNEWHAFTSPNGCRHELSELLTIIDALDKRCVAAESRITEAVIVECPRCHGAGRFAGKAMRIRLNKFSAKQLADEGHTWQCVAVTASTSTVNGSTWPAKSNGWRGLDFTRECWIDGRTGDQKSEYLHVAFCHPNDRGRDDWVTYRVRCRLELGDSVQTQAGPLIVAAVEVAGIIDGKWQWRLSMKKAEAT